MPKRSLSEKRGESGDADDDEHDEFTIGIQHQNDPPRRLSAIFTARSRVVDRPIAAQSRLSRFDEDLHARRTISRTDGEPHSIMPIPRTWHRAGETWSSGLSVWKTTEQK